MDMEMITLASSVIIGGGSIAGYLDLKRDLVYESQYLGRDKEKILERYKSNSTLDKIIGVIQPGRKIALNRFKRGKFDNAKLNRFQIVTAQMSVFDLSDFQ